MILQVVTGVTCAFCPYSHVIGKNILEGHPFQGYTRAT